MDVATIGIQHEDCQRYGVGDPAKFLFVLAKLNFRSLAVLNVGRRSVPLDNLSAVVAQRDASMQEPAVLPVRSSSHTRFIFERPSR